VSGEAKEDGTTSIFTSFRALTWGWPRRGAGKRGPAGRQIKKHLFLKAWERLSDGEKRKLKTYIEAYLGFRKRYGTKEQPRLVYKAPNKVQARVLLKVLFCVGRVHRRRWMIGEGLQETARIYPQLFWPLH